MTGDPLDDIVPAVGFANTQATTRATRHLLDLCHRNLAMIAGLTDGSDRQRDRIAAFGRCLAETGADGSDRIITHGFDMAAGGTALAEI